VFEHDFGIVLTRTEHVHRFAIKNDQNVPWKVERIESTCACSVVDARLDTILPAEEGFFDFRYRAGSAVQDAVGEVRVILSPAQLPNIILRTTAKVRQPVSVWPSEVSFLVDSSSKSEAKEIRVDNFTNADWNGVTADELPQWLEIVGQREMTVSGGEQRQSWLLRLEASMDGSVNQPFERRAITIRPTIADASVEPSGDTPSGVLIASYEYQRALAVIPEVLNFGVIYDGSARSAEVVIRSTARPLPEIEEIKIDKQLNCEVDVSLERLTERVLKLHTTTSGPTDSEFLDGTIIVTIDGFSPVTIPAQGRKSAGVSHGPMSD
jgi:hypothetical protein